MNKAKNRSIIRKRLKQSGSMSGIALNAKGPEGAEGLLETIKEMRDNGEIELGENGLFRLPAPRQKIINLQNPPNQSEIDDFRRGLPNLLIAIGSVSDYQCFLNVSITEALEMSGLEPEELGGNQLKAIAFHDKLSAYDISIP